MTTKVEDSDGKGAVRFRSEGGIAFLTFDRPAARNAMTWRMYEQLAEGIAHIEADRSIRVAVLRGAGGRAFVAGTDIEQFTAFESGDDGIAYEHRIESYVEALERLSVPSIAVVEGLAVGGGLAIANTCDIRIATPGARFGVPIARTLGNCLSPGNVKRLCATLGVALVKRMLLLAEMPTAEMLLATGYITAIVEPDALDKDIASLCDRLLSHAPVTMRVSKEMLYRLSNEPQPDVADLIRSCYGSEDFRTGVAAFLNKQTPQWQGK